MVARDKFESINLSWIISKVEKSRLVLPRGHSLLLRKRTGPLSVLLQGMNTIPKKVYG